MWVLQTEKYFSENYGWWNSNTWCNLMTENIFDHMLTIVWFKILLIFQHIFTAIESKYQTHGENSSKFYSLLSYTFKNTVIHWFPLLFFFSRFNIPLTPWKYIFWQQLLFFSLLLFDPNGYTLYLEFLVVFNLVFYYTLSYIDH